MRRTVAILGTLLIAAVFIISSSALGQPTHWVDHYEPTDTTNCSNPTWAEGSPDDDNATVGQNPSTLGVLMLDLGTDPDDWMPPSQLFTVCGYSGTGDNINETYNITIYSNGMEDSYGPLNGWDSAELDFTTPPTEDITWRYYQITGTSGLTSRSNEDDTIYGPEIDAVGW